ncbi:SIR2 family protein [Enterococcus faecium]
MEKYETQLEEFELLEDIRKKLWTVDGKSRVSIMVGAGFSRNASKIDNSLHSMALWSDLRNKLIEELGSKSEYDNLDILSLGDIYEKKFGIISLENLLKSEIPDDNYEPNSLYTKLLSLPFSDIYTTNYDTLLERAAKDVFTRRYQIIYDIHDIPGSVSPRIVKLHGSFPSHRPFIFSKQSYTSYPDEFAPFVNMVQQSIMETTMILIGFSGDDPNFQKWINWVSGSLGKHRPKIYMLGLDINDNNLISKNDITVLDFKKIYNNSKDVYSVFFEELFDFLSINPTVDQRKWPYQNYTCISNNELVDVDEFLEILKSNREQYPGWLVLPSKIKNRQWMSKIIDSYFFILNRIEDLNKKIAFAFELIWLCKVFRIPIFYEQQKCLEEIVNAYDLNGNNNKIVDIILFLIREYRMDSSKNFLYYVSLLDDIQLDSNQRNELTYQKILWQKDLGQKDETKKRIDLWEIDNQSLEYLLKKGCILLEIGDIDEALLIIKDILQSARRIQSISSKNFFALSVEGIVLMLLQKYDRKIIKDNYFNRLIELDQNFCFPQTTIDYVSNFKREKHRNSVEVKKSYDGKVTTSYNIGNYGISDVIDSFYLMSLHEDYGIGIDQNHRLDILKYLYTSYPNYSQKKFFYFAKEKEIDEFFSKEQIYSLSPMQIDSLYSFLLNILKDDSFDNTVMVMDVLFRLYAVVDKQRRIELETLLFTWYSSGKKINLIKIKARKIFNACFERILQTKYGEELNEIINKLYKLPIVGEKETSLENVHLDEHLTFDPLKIAYKFIPYMNNFSLELGTYTIDKLLIYLQDNTFPISVRLGAWDRLIFLNQIKRIPDSEYPSIEKIVKKMLKRNDKVFREYLKSFAVTTFVKEKAYLLEYMSEIVKKDFYENMSNNMYSNGINLSYQLNELQNLLINGKYEQSIYEQIIINIGKWWENQYEYAKELEKDGNFMPNTDLTDMVMFIKNGILKQIQKKFFNKRMKLVILKCFNDLLNSRDPRSILLIPGVLKLSNEYNHLILDLNMKILSADKKVNENAIEAIYDIAILKNKKEINVSVRDLKVILLQLFAVQKESTLNLISRIIFMILRDSKNFFTDKEKETISFNIDQFYILFLSIENQTVFNKDVFIEIVINYLNIIYELKKMGISVDEQQWKEYCSQSSYSEIQKFNFILDKILV